MNEEPDRQNRKPAKWILIIAGWVIALAFSAALIAFRAPRVETADPIMPFLVAPVWLVSLVLVSVGTVRVMQFLKNTTCRVIITVFAISAQCFVYYLLLVVLAIYVHLLAGGHL